MISVLLMFSPLILAAALIGFALLGSALGAKRRRLAELYVGLPIGFLAVAAHFVFNVITRRWAQAAVDVALAIAWSFRWRSIKANPSTDQAQAPGGAS